MRSRMGIMIAPLGGVPNEEALRKFGELLQKAEGRHQGHLLLDPDSDWDTVRSFFWSVLEKVRGEDGLRAFQVNGKGATRGYVRLNGPLQASATATIGNHATGSVRLGGPLETSALAVVGVHAARSVYFFYYERLHTDWGGKVPDRTAWVRRRVHAYPEGKKELEILERKLFQRYPRLENAVRTLKAHSPFIGAVERGLATFLLDATEKVTHVLVGKALFPIRYRLGPYSPEDVRLIPEGTLAETLWKRTDLGALAPEEVLALLRGEGDVREAERVWALARLSEF